jgi:hypothetical protein
MQIDMREIWSRWGRGEVSDAEAQAAAERSHQGVAWRANGTVTATVLVVSRPRHRPRSPDRERSVRRRRHLAACGGLPPALAAMLTTGEQAVLFIVAGEHRHHGFCDRSVGELAARAGVSVRLAQYALREAERRGLIRIQERPLMPCRNDTNILTVIDRAWLLWLSRGPKSGCKTMHPTVTSLNSGKVRPVGSPKADLQGRKATNRLVRRQALTDALDGLRGPTTATRRLDLPLG